MHRGKAGRGVSLPRGRGASFQFAQRHLIASRGPGPFTREQAWLEIGFMFTTHGLGGRGDAGSDVLFSLCSRATPSDQHGTPPMSANMKGWGETLQTPFASCLFCCAVLISEAGRCVLA